MYSQSMGTTLLHEENEKKKIMTCSKVIDVTD